MTRLRDARFWLQAAIAVGTIAVVALLVFVVELVLITQGGHSTGITVRILTTTP